MAAAGMGRKTFVIDARPEAVSGIRREVAELARAMPFTDQQIEDIELAVGEAVSNAVKHGSPAGECSRITIRCECLKDCLVIEVSDGGSGFDPEAQKCDLPDRQTEAGRGMFFMRSLTDEMTFRFGKGTTVRLVKQLKSD